MTDHDPDPRLRPTWSALEMVIDPEVGLDIVTMGLVYGVAIVDDVAHVTYSLTSRGCPLEAVITRGIRESVSLVRDLAGVEPHLVWEPEWHPGMIAREALAD